MQIKKCWVTGLVVVTSPLLQSEAQEKIRASLVDNLASFDDAFLTKVVQKCIKKLMCDRNLRIERQRRMDHYSQVA